MGAKAFSPCRLSRLFSGSIDPKGAKENNPMLGRPATRILLFLRLENGQIALVLPVSNCYIVPA
jgi:hypothetical protein